MAKAKRKEFTEQEKRDIEAYIRDEHSKGRPMSAIRERLKAKYGAFDWLTLLKLAMEIFFKLWK